MKKYQALKAYYKETKREHFSRSENIPARLNTGYLDIINYYKRIADHTYNITAKIGRASCRERV